MVLVLSIPDSIHGKDALVAMTFGVVVLSVLIQGSTMGPLVRALGLVEKRSDAMIFMSRGIAKLRAISAQQSVYTNMAMEEGIYNSTKVAERLNNERHMVLKEIEERSKEADFIIAQEERVKYIEMQLKDVEEDSLRKSADSHLITEDDLNDLIKVSET